MARKNQSRLVSGLMLPWKNVGHTGYHSPIYRFSYGTIFGEPLFSAEASVHIMDPVVGPQLIVEVNLRDREGQYSGAQKEYTLRSDLSEEELLALASEMTFEVIAEFYSDLIHFAIAR